MKLSAAMALVEKLSLAADEFSASEYYSSFDESGNLNVNFVGGEIIQFPVIPLRPYQKDTHYELFVKTKKRFFLVRPRRAGKEVESWNAIVKSAVNQPGLYLMIYPTNVRARMVLWEGAIVMPDGSSKRFLDMIPKKMLSKKPNDAEMVIKLINGSVIWVLGSDIDPDKLRGTNPRGVVCSEYAYSDPRVFHILMPVLRQNGGWVILQTTFNGMNHAYRFMQSIKDNPDWYCRVDSVESLVDENGNRYVTDKMIDDDRRSGMPEFMIQQEYYSLVQLNEETLYFANQMNTIEKAEKILPDLILPGKRVRTHFDIGWDDECFVLLEQMDRNGDPTIIHCIENNNKTFEFYIREAEKFCAINGLYMDRNIYLPHDGRNRSFNTGKNSEDYAAEMGYHAHIMERPSSQPSAIQAMRQMLYRTKINKTNCSRFIDCMSNYSKEFDTKKGVYKDYPKHDWTSHGVKAFQTMTFAYNKGLVNEQMTDIVYINP